MKTFFTVSPVRCYFFASIQLMNWKKVSRGAASGQQSWKTSMFKRVKWVKIQGSCPWEKVLRKLFLLNDLTKIDCWNFSPPVTFDKTQQTGILGLQKVLSELFWGQILSHLLTLLSNFFFSVLSNMDKKCRTDASNCYLKHRDLRMRVPQLCAFIHNWKQFTLVQSAYCAAKNWVPWKTKRVFLIIRI